MNRVRIAVLLAAGALAAACGRHSGEPDIPPDSIVPPDTTRPPGPRTVWSVLVSPTYQSVSAGASTQISATPRDSAGNALTDRVVTFTSSDNQVATVDGSGTVTTVGPGVAIITAASEGRSSKAAVSVPLATASGPIQHVFIVVEENVEYSNIHNSPSVPYLNALARQYGLATNYFGNTHPSIGNYFMMTVGTVSSNDNNFTGPINDDNIVRRLLAAGKTWKAYAEDIPSVGYTGIRQGLYVRRHNPLSYLSDVLNDSNQLRNVVPFSQLAADLASGNLPNYSFIIPNMCNDAHDCPMATMDEWLSRQMGPILRHPKFRSSGLLVITFDEGVTGLNGGGKIITVAVGPRVKRNFQSSTFFQHQSLLRWSLEVLGINSFPGASGGAPSMMEFLAN